MNKKSKMLFLSVLGAMISSTAIAQTEAPRLIGGVSMLPKTVNDDLVEVSNIGGSNGMVMDIGVDSEEFFDEPVTRPGYGEEIRKPQNRANQLKDMETDFLPKAENISGIGGSQADNANFDAMGSGVSAQGVQNTAQQNPESNTPVKRVKAPKKAPVVVTTISTFNTQTIQNIEEQARARDSAKYQKFLMDINNK